MRRMVVGAILALAMAPAAWADTVRLTFVHVNDVYEILPGKDGGGLAELKGAVDAERARSANLVFTFGGDLISPSLASGFTKGTHMISLMNGAGVDVAVLGNHEFDFGSATLRLRMAESRFPWLVSNVLEQDGRPFANGVLTWTKQVGGVKVGFLGVLTETTGKLSAGGKDTRFDPAIDTAKRLAAELKAQGAEVVVALTHLNLEEDRQLAREGRQNIDLILGGHDHDPYTLMEGGPLVLKAGSNAEFLAVVDLEVTREGGKVSVRPAGWRLTSTIGAPADPVLKAEVAKVQAGLSDELNRRLTVLRGAMSTTQPDVRRGESAFGNVMADALRESLKADLALINGGGLRANRDYADGHELTMGDLRKEMPFDNGAVLIEVSGADIRAALENGVSAAPNAAGRFPQVSGLTFTYSAAKPAGQRVGTVTVGGKPLDLAGTYKLATIDYLADGGDGYTVFKDAKRLITKEASVLAVTKIAEVLADKEAAAGKIEGRSKAE